MHEDVYNDKLFISKGHIPIKQDMSLLFTTYFTSRIKNNIV